MAVRALSLLVVLFRRMLLCVITAAVLAAILLIGAGSEERFFTVLAQPDRGFGVGDRKENGHLQPCEQGVIVPHHHRLV